MWHKLEFERKLEEKLHKDFGSEVGSEYFTRYAYFRDRLIADNALDGIKSIEPGLTDHGPVHIAHVMNNVYKLLGGLPQEYLSALEYYCLALMILFHDTGNIFGRNGHPQNAYLVYDYFKGNYDNRQERHIILKGIAAHGGKAKDGSEDTLKHLKNNESVDGEVIRLRELAALLRFGDELAEGRKRTSLFMQNYHKYPTDSKIFHEYASIIDLLIDRNNERIAVAYNFHVDSENHDESEFEQLFEFTIKRLWKLDVERRYNKNYSELLSPFKYTIATFNVYVDGELMDDVVSDEIILRDLFPTPDQIKPEMCLSDYGEKIKTGLKDKIRK